MQLILSFRVVIQELVGGKEMFSYRETKGLVSKLGHSVIAAGNQRREPDLVGNQANWKAVVF